MNVNILREIDYEAKCYKDVKMKLRNLSMSENRKSQIYHRKTKNKSAQIEYDLDVMFDCMIFDITNLTVTDENKKVVEIKTGKDILDNPGLNDLYNELVPVLIEMEARIDSKN